MNRRSIINLIAVAVLCLLAIGGYALWYGIVANKSAEAAELRSRLGAHGEAGNRAAFARSALAELGPKEEETYRHLVAADDIVPFLEGLETTGDRLGSSVEVISVTNSQTGDALALSLRITGSFDAVMRTLGAVEYQTYDTVLTSLTLDTLPEEGSAWSAAASFTVGMRQKQP